MLRKLRQFHNQARDLMDGEQRANGVFKMAEFANLKGKTVVVTGGGQGIGAATVETFCSAGAFVVVVDRDTSQVRPATSPGKYILLQADVVDTALPERLDAVLRDTQSTIDVLVNNAGHFAGGDALAASEDEIWDSLNVNVMAVFRLSRWAISKMISRGGSIVNISSIFGTVGTRNTCGYSASKAALIGMTRQMATDFGPNGIRVNAIAPGVIETARTAKAIRSDAWYRQVMIDGAPLRRSGTPEEVAATVRFLSSSEAGFITGQVISVDGGWAIGRFPREHPIKATLPKKTTAIERGAGELSRSRRGGGQLR